MLSEIVSALMVVAAAMGALVVWCVVVAVVASYGLRHRGNVRLAPAVDAGARGAEAADAGVGGASAA